MLSEDRRTITRMRLMLLLIAAGFLLIDSVGGARRARMEVAVISPAPVSASSEAQAQVDFETQLKPIFQSKCMPCHFNGGQMYERLPFDKAETIKKLGHRLFTRIKDENDRKLIEDFLSQSK